MKKISLLIIIAGVLIAAYPLYQWGYTYYWQTRLQNEVVAIDEATGAGAQAEVEAAPPAEEKVDTLKSPGKKPVEKPKYRIGASIGTIIIPKIKLNMPIIVGDTDENMTKGVAWMEESGIIGQNGNAVLASHRGSTYGRLFNRLGEMKVNDTFTIRTKGETYSYVVYKVRIVKPTETSVLSQPKSSERVTLITCTSIYESANRIIVIARRQ